MHGEDIFTAKPAVSFSVLGKECRLTRQGQTLASVQSVLPPPAPFSWGPRIRESSIWERGCHWPCQGGTVQRCEKAACPDLPKPKPTVSLEPLRWIFYKSIQVVCLFFTFGEFPLLPPSFRILPQSHPFLLHLFIYTYSGTFTQLLGDQWLSPTVGTWSLQRSTDTADRRTLWFSPE